MKKAMRFIALALAMVLTFTVPAFAEDNNLKNIDETPYSKLFNMIASDLVELYQYDITKDTLLTRTITTIINEDHESLDIFFRALFGSLDEYSEFYTPEEYRTFMQTIENVTGGLGVYITSNGRYVEVASTVTGSPAYRAGIKSGDAIYKVDGEDMTSKGSDYVSARLRGEIGTEVAVTVLRDGEEIEFTLVRGEITQKTVDYGLVGDKIAYLQIMSFSGATASEVETALAELDKLGVKKIILDLRNNTGGYVDSAVSIAKKFVPKGIIVTHNMKYGNQKTEYRSDLIAKKYELVTLVNEYTASSAEILASALKESGASKLVGAQTFGKAVTQSIHPVYGGRMCKITSGEYTTRNGNKINKVGIAPDYAVSNMVTELENTDIAPMKYAPLYKQGDKADGILGVKKRLSVLGYSVGTVNDEFDETLKYAIEVFQKDMGLEVTGELDITTQMFAVEKARDCKVVIDRQAAKAFELIGAEYGGYLLGE